jgi:hypothetical protein
MNAPKKREPQGCLFHLLFRDLAFGGGSVPPPSAPPCTAKPLLSPAERAFHAVLLQALPPRTVLFVRVRLADIISVDRSDSEGMRWWNKLYSHHADFLLCAEGDLRPLLAIKLDDPSLNSEQAQREDIDLNAALSSAGIELVRFRSEHTYSAAALAEALTAALGKRPQQ